MYVPCGHCVLCRIAHSREWAVRITHELSYHSSAVFLTLTYDNDHYPGPVSDYGPIAPGSISKYELQIYFKRVRRSLERNKRIKYFACGEYGETDGRPHYHAIVFGLDRCNHCMYCNYKYRINQVDPLPGTGCYILFKAWCKGFIYVGTVTFDSARYVADYTNKSQYRHNNFFIAKQRPFQLQSRGLGLQFVLDNSDYLIDKLGCTIRGVNVGLPKYYRKKLGISTDDMYNASKEAAQKIRDYLLSQGLRGQEIYDKISESRIMSEKTAVAKRNQRRNKF